MPTKRVTKPKLSVKSEEAGYPKKETLKEQCLERKISRKRKIVDGSAKYASNASVQRRNEKLASIYIPSLTRWQSDAIALMGDVVGQTMQDALGIRQDAEGNDKPVDGKLVNGARAILFDRLWPKGKRDLLSVKVPAMTLDIESIRASCAVIIAKVARQELPLDEGERMVALLSKLIDIDAARELDKLRGELAEVRRSIEGGSANRVIEGEVVPSWGRFEADDSKH